MIEVKAIETSVQDDGKRETWWGELQQLAAAAKIPADRLYRTVKYLSTGRAEPWAIDVDVLANRIGVSPQSLYRLIRNGDIPAKQYGRRFVIPMQWCRLQYGDDINL